jgi:hypothetical protein
MISGNPEAQGRKVGRQSTARPPKVPVVADQAIVAFLALGS